jgi:hypothetical protein
MAGDIAATAGTRKGKLYRPATKPRFSSPCINRGVSVTVVGMTDELAQAVESGALDKKTADRLARLTPGSYCTHKSWGFGRVAEWNLLAGQVLIDFKRS